MAGIARVTAPYRCGPGRARRGAICKIGPRPGQTLLALRAFGGGRADPRRPMAMPATVFAVVVTSIGCKATRVRCGGERQKSRDHECRSAHGPSPSDRAIFARHRAGIEGLYPPRGGRKSVGWGKSGMVRCDYGG